MKAGTKWTDSFRYAYEGLQYALRTQRHMRFHFFAAFVVLFASLLLRVSVIDLLFVALAVALVISLELMNTAIEKTVDLASPDEHPLAKIAKDVAAAAVLVAASFAVVVGIAVFYPHMAGWIATLRVGSYAGGRSSVWVLVVLAAIAAALIASLLPGTAVRWRPSSLFAAACAAATLILLSVNGWMERLLALLLLVLLAVILSANSGWSPARLATGGIVGIAVTLLAFAFVHG